MSNRTREQIEAEVLRLRAALLQAEAELQAVGPAQVVPSRAESKVAARALLEAEERYRLAADATSEAIWDWDLLTNHVLWNAALEQAYGHLLATVETTGEWWIAHIHPEDRTRIATSIHAVIDGPGISWSDKYRFLRRDGSYAEVLDRGRVVRNDQGKAVRMIGAMFDLTSMRASEQALRRSEERLQAIVEAIETAFAIVEVKFDEDDEPVDYRFIDVNPAFERQAGVDLRGKWVTEYAPELESFWFETYGRVAKTRVSANFENYAKHFERWFDVRAVPVGDPQERQIGIFFNDTTARRNAEEKLRASEALARENAQHLQLALAAGAIIGTWHWDLPTNSFTVDEAFALTFGIDPTLGRDGLSLEQVVSTVHPDDHAGLIDAINEVIGRGGSYAHQYRVRRLDGNYYWIEANGRVDLAEDGTPKSFPGVLLDMHERRTIQAERDRVTMALRALTDTLEERVLERTAALTRSEEKLRQSQKMEAVGQLTGGLAHDFNNLLAGISGSLELMTMRLAQGRTDQLDKYVSAAQGAATRAAAVTHRLLAFSRRQPLDARPTDVNALIASMSELIQRTVGPSITVVPIWGEALWTVRVDSSQLENALLNLCINARDAMPNGGRIVIETANQWVGRETAQTLDLAEGDYIALSVTDTGTGMTPDVIAKAFDPFFTTKPIGQGTGLGLSMIYGFAKQSGGNVRIHSEVANGTCLTLYLAKHLGDATEPVGSSEQPKAELTRNGAAILIVDDEPTVRMLLAETLDELGYTVIEAADSLRGLEILRSDVRIDLLVTDVGLPGGMNGRQMADAGREIRPGLKTLFITGYAENAAIGDGHLPPDMEVMTKPFSIEALAIRVSEMTVRPFQSDQRVP